MAIFLSYLFYFVASSLGSLQRRYLLRDKDYTTAEQITFTFRCILILFAGSLFFPFFSPFYLTGGAVKIIILSLIAGICGAAANLANYIAQKHLDAGITSIVWNIYTPVTIILSSILLHEGLTPLQIIGTVLLLVAIVLISKNHRTGRFTFNKYFLLMLLGGVILSGVLIAERALQKTTGFSAGVMLSWGSQAAMLGLLSLWVGDRHTYTSKEVWTTGIFQFVGALSYVILVWVAGNLSLVTSITTFKVVVVFAAAALWLHEREDLPRKILGCVIAVAGLLLMG